MKILYIDLTRLFWVYTIILISNIGNLHVYSERTIIRNTRVVKKYFTETIFCAPEIWFSSEGQRKFVMTSVMPLFTYAYISK